MTKATDLLQFYDDLDLGVYQDLAQELASINHLNIEGELLHQARIYSSYAGLLEHAKKECGNLEIELIRCQTNARIEARESCEAKKIKATVAIMDSFVNSDESCIKLTKKLVELKEKEGLLKSLVNALSHRKDCLIQLSTHQRNEKKIYS